MTPETILTLILILLGILACIFLSAFFSGSEMALSGCNLVRLENEADDGKKKAKRALKLAERFDDTLSTILIGNNLVNILASSLTTALVILLSQAFSLSEDGFNLLGTVTVTVLVIIFGETVPKIMAKKKATTTAKRVSLPLAVLRVIFYPITFPVVSLVKCMTGRIRAEEEDHEEETTEELQSIIETAEDEGVLDAERSELVSAAIDFKDITADEAMTARVDMEAIDIDADRAKIIKIAVESTHSRLPVYEGSIDRIIGVVHLNHLLKALSADKEADVRAVMMEPCFVYRTMKLPAVLNHLKKARQHLAIVVDEYSGTLGVITMEDVLEEIVGDIWDETDEIEEEVVELNDDEKEIDGDMVIDDFLELLHVDPDDFDYESQTVGGFVTEYRGDFPEVGYSFVFAGHEITVLAMEERRVGRVLLKRLPASFTDSRP